jgi:hypothetical protein
VIRVANVDPQQVKDLILGFRPGEHDRLRDLLVEVFQRLPEEDAEILIEERRIRFLLTTRNQAIYLPAGDHYLLVLESSFLNWLHSAQVYTLVHEMAHAFLEHKATSAKVEFLADRRVVRWGFEDELEAVPNSYLRGSGMEQVFGVTRTGIMNE